MELRIYGEPAPPRTEPWWRPRRPRVLRERIEAFERWAAPPTEPEREQEQERSFVPVAVLLAVALAVQYAQLAIPAVRAYLVERDTLYRSSWMGFTVLKQWVLFVLVLLFLQIKEERLAAIGFPRVDARRLGLALGLVGFFLGAALLHAPAVVPADPMARWILPVAAGERALSVALAVTAAVVEESLFRGFAIAWTYRWSGHLPFAVLFPALVFAAGHAALGWSNVAYALLAALGLSGLFLWQRDLYWPMMLHFLLDVLVLLN